ncbi:DUF4389 domain-containing protein [Actinoplanes awajinensis]|uniref:DUF4389 domain-containing protein n=1 Tax=Actinoplanes awajinensis subsp. mycoplanecinus TaxID=135947 RepID=A0A101JB33_9ACTN|nr:DUF4389 domain-containing protein [Actinoplanes awajinensis]KUL23525.1 hypothetical protein ADL15_45990 [Actinoplanes awajinensis subsp. mycoplanecinus]
MDRYPLQVEARRDEPLSRGLWLIKWLLLIPHFVVLLVLWTGVVVLTLAAYLAVLFTGRYPASIRAYNLGVLRWSWRVGYYGYEVLGTDVYPPFTLADVPDYPARLRLDPPERIPRWLPLVAWLFAMPHLFILGALNGAASRSAGVGDAYWYAPLSITLTVVLIGAVALLFTGRYPRGLHDLLLGLARWGLRVAAYLMLLTPRYPPLRLDQGATEPDPVPDAPVAADPPVHPARPSAVGSVIALVVGVLMLAPGIGLGIGGGVLLGLDAARDGAGYVTSPELRVESSTAAITAENLTITDAGVWTRTAADVGGLRVSAISPTGRALFVGIAPQSAVDTWLTGTAHDELVGFTSGRARYERAPGPLRPATGPVDQSFWLAQSSGAGTATLQWAVTDGRYAVVIANLDGSPAVTADVTGAVQVPGLAGLGSGLLIAGVLLFLLAVALIILGGVGLGRRHSPPPLAGQPPTPSVPPVLTGS